MLKNITSSLLIIFMLFVLGVPQKVFAVAPSLAVPSGLSLAEIKMTGDEFVMLQNNTGATIANLSEYSLYGFNKTNPLTAGVNITVQQLPSGVLLDQQTVLLSDGGATCGAAITAKLSISLTDSAGYLEVVKSSLVGSQLTLVAGDAVSWSSGANTTPGMIAHVPSNSSDPRGAWYRFKNVTNYEWQQARTDTNNVCQLNALILATEENGPTNPGSQLLPGLPPPATIISIPVETGGRGGVGIPASDIGLRAPVLNELLPNPAKPQTDADDEFIELYNPNNAVFDLSGFKLQTKSISSSSKRTYTFPFGTKIGPKKFAAYPSKNISISLTNAGAQVWLLDPTEAVISKAEPYGEANDGQAWALANGKWYWTNKPTPGAANVIDGSGGDGTGTQSGNGVGTVQGESSGNGTANTSSLVSPAGDQKASLHPAVLAVVGALALLYGLYEYRHDISNQIHKLKKYRETRRASGKKSSGRGSSRTKK